MKPRLLDLFCKAGGAAKGYSLAGFNVLGVDIEEQPNYPFMAMKCDALEYLEWLCERPMQLRKIAAIHASPPCPRYMRGGLSNRDEHPDLLPALRELLKATGLPWVIENVPGAPMRPDVVLCGSMFGLGVRRHRWFEFHEPTLLMVPPCDHSQPIAGVYGHPHGQAGAWPGMLPSTLESWSAAMDIDWMTAAELADAIPPAYTRLIGEHLMSALVAS